ncbi:MAG: hypothetical protein ACNA8H_05635 [Anaerolineales bacterium]
MSKKPSRPQSNGSPLNPGDHARAQKSIHKHLSRSSSERIWLKAGVISIIFVIILAACAVGPEKQIGFQGYLTDSDGNPINGELEVVFRFFNNPQYCASGSGPNPGQAVFTETHSNVQIANGLMNVEVGENSTHLGGLDGIDPAIFAQPLYLEVVLNGEATEPCQKMAGAPYAMSLAGGAVVASAHEGNGPGGSDDTDENYGALSVIGFGGNATSLIAGVSGEGDIMRGCQGVLASRFCPNLRFRVLSTGEVRAEAFNTPASDFAEMIVVEGDSSEYSPGDVLVISKELDRAVALSTQPNSFAVAGVYSTQPGFVGGMSIDDSVDINSSIPVAIVGIVPVKVSAENGTIQRGDLLTTSGTPGHAMKSTDLLPGTILGKALGELESGTGVIEVLLILR